MLKNLSAAFTETIKVKEFEENIDPRILEQNKQLKIDCYNNLSGNFKIKKCQMLNN